MLVTAQIAEGIKAGTVTMLFRRWERPRATVGGTQRTVAGVIRFTSIDPMQEQDLTEADARAAGMASVAALLKAGEKRAGMQLYRIGVAYERPDERIELREAVPSDDEIAEVAAALDRLDRSRRTGPWTRAMLRMIDERPGVRAPDLAATVGRDTRSFKADVRRLKELGLTESLPIGYRLSPRGRAFVDGSAAR